MEKFFNGIQIATKKSNIFRFLIFFKKEFRAYFQHFGCSDFGATSVVWLGED